MHYYQRLGTKANAVSGVGAGPSLFHVTLEKRIVVLSLESIDILETGSAGGLCLLHNEEVPP